MNPAHPFNAGGRFRFTLMADYAIEWRIRTNTPYDADTFEVWQAIELERSKFPFQGGFTFGEWALVAQFIWKLIPRSSVMDISPATFVWEEPAP